MCKNIHLFHFCHVTKPNIPRKSCICNSDEKHNSLSANAYSSHTGHMMISKLDCMILGVYLWIFICRNAPPDISFPSPSELIFCDQWPIVQLTSHPQDPWPSSRPRHESITTIMNHGVFVNIALSSLQWCAIWNSGLWLMQWIFVIIYTVGLSWVVYTLHGNFYKPNTVNSSVIFL